MLGSLADDLADAGEFVRGEQRLACGTIGDIGDGASGAGGWGRCKGRALAVGEIREDALHERESFWLKSRRRRGRRRRETAVANLGDYSSNNQRVIPVAWRFGIPYEP